MEQSNFSLADVLTLVGSLAFSFICFIGLNFTTGGNITASILISLGIFVLTFTPAFLAKFFKTRDRKFKTNAILEFVMLFIFVIIFFALSFMVMPVSFNITANKGQIQNEVIKEIDQAISMFDSYETYASNRESQYELQMKAVVAGKKTNPAQYREYGFAEDTSVSDDQKIDSKKFALHADLFPSNFEETKNAATEWLNNSKSVINNWKIISVVPVVNQIEDKSNEWLNMMKQCSAKREKGENTDDFDYALSFSSVKNYFKESASATPVSIVISLVIFLVMIMSLIIAKRSTRFPGWKLVFGGNNTRIDNEL